MLGLHPAPPDGCRVLEIGASDGSNLIPLAVAYPNASFVGFDLAAAPVGRGNQDIAALGLTNIRLFQGDILDVDLPDGGFDYIMAQGVYCWVPEVVRQALLPLVRRLLAPQGVGYLSYNTLPGGYLRLAIRRQLIFATRHLESRAERVGAALEMLRSWPSPTEDQGAFHYAVAEEAGRMGQLSLGGLAHDEMNDDYHALHISDFAAHCAREGLQILAEADCSEIGNWLAAPTATGETRFDPLEGAQASDFAGARFFRQSLVVRDDAVIRRAVSDERLRGLHVSSRARRAGGDRFECVGASAFELANAGLAEALAHLGSIFPATAPLADLLEEPRLRMGLLSLCSLNAVELHGQASTFPITAGDRPTVSPLARLQAARGRSALTSLRQAPVGIDDPFVRGLIAGLDGRRTRREIAAEEIAPRVGASQEDAEGRLGKLLDGLGRAALLVA